MKESNKKLASLIGYRLYNVLKRLKFRFIYYNYFSSRLNFEENLLKNRIDFLSIFVKKNDLCFDVGANVGNRVVPLLNIGAKVVAVEPQYLCAKFLNKYFGNRITTVESAVGSRESTATMYMCDETTISSLSNEWIDAVKRKRFKYNQWDRTQTVAVTTLDQLILKYGKPQFIKIDVEGYELEVLKGLSQKIDVISYEYTVPEMQFKAVDCLLEIKRVNPTATCNYTVGENTKFELDDWLLIDEMSDYMNSSKFIESNFGDIYVKNTDLYMN